MPYEQMSEQKLQFVTFILNTLSKTFKLTYIPANCRGEHRSPTLHMPVFPHIRTPSIITQNQHKKNTAINSPCFYHPHLRHLNLSPLRIVITTAVHTVLDIIKCLQHFLGRLLCAKAHNNDKYKTYRKTYYQ